MCMKPEERWEYLPKQKVWGVKILPGMRMRDLPQDLRLAGVPKEGVLHPFIFEGKKFFSIDWVQKHPLDWPEARRTEVLPGDYLVEGKNGKIYHLQQVSEGG